MAQHPLLQQRFRASLSNCLFSLLQTRLGGARRLNVICLYCMWQSGVHQIFTNCLYLLLVKLLVCTAGQCGWGLCMPFKSMAGCKLLKPASLGSILEVSVLQEKVWWYLQSLTGECYFCLELFKIHFCYPPPQCLHCTCTTATNWSFYCGFLVLVFSWFSSVFLLTVHFSGREQLSQLARLSTRRFLISLMLVGSHLLMFTSARFVCSQILN